MDNKIIKELRIKFFPISIFSTILGLVGFTIAFQRAEMILNFPFNISNVLLGISLFLFLLISSLYLFKILKYSNEVRLEFRHPIKISFFPTISISLLLFSVAFLSLDMDISFYFWALGTFIQFLFTVKIISVWIQHTNFEITHMSPAWFIPAVGNILVPISGIGHNYLELSYFFFSIGLFFWIILMVIFFNRIIFHSPLPQKLLPTLFILIAPPAIGFVSIVKIMGEVNEFSRFLYYFGLFVVCLLFFQVKLFRKIKFFLSWWAYSFPIAAITIASILMYHETSNPTFKIIAYALFSILNVVILILLSKTISALFRKEICVED